RPRRSKRRGRPSDRDGGPDPRVDLCSRSRPWPAYRPNRKGRSTVCATPSVARPHRFGPPKAPGGGLRKRPDPPLAARWLAAGFLLTPPALADRLPRVWLRSVLSLSALAAGMALSGVAVAQPADNDYSLDL